MSTIYVAPGAGPWAADDTQIVGDGWLNNGNILHQPTVDGLTDAKKTPFGHEGGLVKS